MISEIEKEISELRNHLQKLTLEIGLLKKELKRERECVDYYCGDWSGSGIYEWKELFKKCNDTKELRKLIL